jgi:hypothetical protein
VRCATKFLAAAEEASMMTMAMILNMECKESDVE